MTSRDERRGSKRTDRQRGRERMSDSTVAAEKGDRGRTAVSFNRAVLGHKYCFAIFVCLCTCFSWSDLAASSCASTISRSAVIWTLSLKASSSSSMRSVFWRKVSFTVEEGRRCQIRPVVPWLRKAVAFLQNLHSADHPQASLTFTCWEFSDRLSSLFLASSISRAFLLFSTCSLCFSDATFFDWSFICLQEVSYIRYSIWSKRTNQTSFWAPVPLEQWKCVLHTSEQQAFSRYTAVFYHFELTDAWHRWLIHN